MKENINESKFNNPLSSCHLIHMQITKSQEANQNNNIPKILEQNDVLNVCLDYLDGEISYKNVLEQVKDNMSKKFLCDIAPVYLFGAPVNPHYTVGYKTTLQGGVIDFLFGINPELLRRRDLIMQLFLALEDEELLITVISQSGEHMAIHRGVIPEDKPLIAIGRGGPLSHALWVKGFIFHIDFTEEWGRMLELRYENDDLPELNWIKTNYTNEPYLKCQKLDKRLPEHYRQSLLSTVKDQQQSKYQQQTQQQSRDQQQQSQVSIDQNMNSTQTFQNKNINKKNIDIYQFAIAQEEGFIVNGRLISYSDIQSTMDELCPQSVNVLVTKALKFKAWTCDECIKKLKLTTYYFGQLKYHLQQTRHESILYDKYMDASFIEDTDINRLRKTNTF